jgi:hypothetical protein
MSQSIKYNQALVISHALIRHVLGNLLDFWTFKYDGVLRGDERLPEEEIQKVLKSATWFGSAIPTWLAIDYLTKHPEHHLEQYDSTIAGWEDSEIRLVLHQFHDYVQIALDHPLSSDLFEIEFQEIDYATWRETEQPKINQAHEHTRLQNL